MKIMIWNVVNYAITILNLIILIRVILSWLVPYKRNEFTEVVYAVTEPVLAPFRTLIPMGSMRIDLSPAFAYIALNVLRRIIFYIMF
ncbi:YggT family protein [Fusobacterium sp. MFO224]|uniref:YggT family protein n=1 Tax=Fusobacterium sp. MFO224 TaxID=3378070 RepID=UPI0038553B20